MDNAAEVNRLDFVSRSLRRLVEDLRIKRAVKEKECRALMLSRRRRHNEVGPLPKPSVARHRDNPNAERENQRKKHHRPGCGNFSDVIIAAAPE
jgi:hypothetical protein